LVDKPSLFVLYNQEKLNYFFSVAFLRDDRIIEVKLGPFSFDPFDQEESPRRDFSFWRGNFSRISFWDARLSNLKTIALCGCGWGNLASSKFGDFNRVLRQFTWVDRKFEGFDQSFGKFSKEYESGVNDASGRDRAFAHARWSALVCSYGGRSGGKEKSFPGDQNYHELLVQACMGILFSFVSRDSPFSRAFASAFVEDRGGADRFKLGYDYFRSGLLHQKSQTVG
jgi:hypothetical protein